MVPATGRYGFQAQKALFYLSTALFTFLKYLFLVKNKLSLDFQMIINPYAKILT